MLQYGGLVHTLYINLLLPIFMLQYPHRRSLGGFAERVAWCLAKGCLRLGTPIGAAWGFVFEIKIAKRLITFKLGAVPPIPRRGILISSTYNTHPTQA